MSYSTTGNPYKDVIALEPAQLNGGNCGDLGAVLAELATVKAMLAVLLEAQGLQVVTEGPGEIDQAFPRYGDGSTLSDNPAEREAYQAHFQAEGQPPASVMALWAWFLSANGNGG